MSQHPDQHIDQVLAALRDTQPPVGLEARIRARLRQTMQQPARPICWYSSPWTLAATAVAVLLVLTAITFHPRTHHEDIATSPLIQNNPQPSTQVSVLRSSAIPNLSSRQESALFADGAERPAIKTATELSTNPEAIALAETLAPSHPAPAMPLTPQERLLARATRPGQPIEIAELELAREPALRAVAQARERTDIQRYVRAVLSPLVLSESLNPTPQTTDFQSAPNPPSTSTN
jgi:hypothetical protein